jgi:hypothetical protein
MNSNDTQLIASATVNPPISLTTTVNPLPDIRENPTIKEYFKVYVYFRGIKKRCRKIESHSMFIDYQPYNNGTYDYDALIAKVTGFLQTNVKHIDKTYYASITLDYVQETFDGFMTSQLWQPFSDKNIKVQINPSYLNLN